MASSPLLAGLSELLPIGGAPFAQELSAFLGVFVRHLTSRKRGLWSGDHDTAGLADRATKSPFPATIVARHQNAEMHSHIAGLAFRAGNTRLGGRLHVDGYPRGPGWMIAVYARGRVDFLNGYAVPAILRSGRNRSSAP
jgi:hypothetical protein